MIGHQQCLEEKSQPGRLESQLWCVLLEKVQPSKKLCTTASLHKILSQTLLNHPATAN